MTETTNKKKKKKQQQYTMMRRCIFLPPPTAPNKHLKYFLLHVERTAHIFNTSRFEKMAAIRLKAIIAHRKLIKHRPIRPITLIRNESIIPSRFTSHHIPTTIINHDAFSFSSFSSSSSSQEEPFYGSPIPENKPRPLSPLQTLSLTAYSATKAFLDPERHDMVATLSELTGQVALQSMYNTMKEDTDGQRILLDKPLVSKSSIDIDDLRNKGKHTFGYAYAMFLKRNGFDPDLRAEVKYVHDDELRYVMMRYRQSHDFYHVITDLPPTIPGELALKYAELFQTGLPVCALSATVGSFKLEEEERKVWKDLYLPWAIKAGKGKSWMNVYWEERFDQDIDELREELSIDMAPKV